MRTPAEGWKLLARWEKMGAAIDQNTANLRRGLAAGKVATADEVRRVLGQLDDLLAKPDDKWPLRAPASAAHADWPPAERLAFTRAIDAAIAGAIRPAFERHRAALRSEILPRARDGAHAGILNVPGGVACYPRLIQVHTSLALPPQEIHRIGLEEWRASTPRWRGWGGRRSAWARCPSCGGACARAAALYFQTRAEVEAAARKALARAQAAEPRFLGKPPRTPCVVKRIDEFEERDAPIAYYRPAAIDGSRPGTYHVNTYEPKTRARYEVEALAFHESVPGHHIQIAIAQELTGLPEFRKHAGVTAFIEGWGLYAEGLADELGLYKGARERLGRLNFDAWRACRLVVDTGIHAMGWSRERAIAFFEDNVILAREKHRQRGRPLHRVAGPGAGVQAGRAGDPQAARAGAGAAGRALRHARCSTIALLGRRRGQPARAARRDRGVAGDRAAGAGDGSVAAETDRRAAVSRASIAAPARSAGVRLHFLM